MWDTLGTLPTIAYALGFRVCKVVILGFGFYYLSKHIYIYIYIKVYKCINNLQHEPYHLYIIYNFLLMPSHVTA